MAAFHYQALTKEGMNCKGIVEAESEQQARQLVRERALILIAIRSVHKQNSLNKGKLAASNLTLFTRQLATLVAADIPIEESLQALSEQTTTTKVRELIASVRLQVLQGYSLAEAMSEFPHAFPALYQATIKAGEQTGRLDVVLEKLADYTETQQSIKQKIKQALIYPSLIVFVSFTIVSFLLAFIVPKIIEVFVNSGQTLPAMTQVLIFISNWVKKYGIYTIGLMIIASLLFKRALRYPTFKKAWHATILKVPIASYLIKSTNLARYIHTFSILFTAGVNVMETMQIAASLITNQVMGQAFEVAGTKVREGASISSALLQTEFLTPMATHLINSGEKSGHITLMMERTAAYLDNEVRRLIDCCVSV